ncbi:drug/metabolite transporter (DMT)-like permease [Blastococcus xanthinilyticus]|uniref:Drug/metabolite transporter (DMT)-like permease n=1 Tax=Blastococcus xanthinilyticus TaxID=1564164 RepID=A0A5S5CW73_9ACTN|nr:drug/metabolite transporter (DMT)-like permease [Blastococcus xanthinilyticus]
MAALVDAAPVGQPAAPAVLAGTVAMGFVGSSVAISAVLTDAPLFTAQSLRYALACLLLAGFARAAGRRIVRPRGAEWAWLLGIVATGMVLFNVALVRGSEHAEPAVIGVAVASVPVLLAVIGPLLEGRRPRGRVLAAAAVVTVGAALVQGLGRSDAEGLAWAVVVLLCEAGFTLLALPLLARHGAWGVSVHTTWLAAVVLGVLGVAGEGPAAALRLSGTQLAATGYLAVGMTAVAFVLWYSAVGRLGSARAGLLTGVAPVAAAAVGVAMGGAAPGPLVWLGIGVVAAGLAVGLGAAGTGTPGGARPHRAGPRPRAAADQSRTAVTSISTRKSGSNSTDTPIIDAGAAEPAPSFADARPTPSMKAGSKSCDQSTT